jgi:uncharacterized iron-regulated membrane protein
MRRLFVWLHRYVGLALAAFLIIEGLTGALLAFNADLRSALDPRLVARKPAPDAQRLSFAALARRAEVLEPTEHVAYFAENSDERAVMRMWGRHNPETGGRYPDVPFHVTLDPWTGERLADVAPASAAARFLAAVMPFLYQLHVNLAVGETGVWVLCFVALAWTIDCFVGFYLTLPVSLEKFWRRWRPAWLVKWRGGSYRVNFDLHRAGGVWLWLMLFVFAWSSVTLTDRIGAYDWVMGRLFDYQDPVELLGPLFPQRQSDAPFKLDWEEAQATGERLMTEEAAHRGFKIVRPSQLNRFEESRLYNYVVLTDRPFPQDQTATVFFDADTGAFHASLSIATGHAGNTVTNWLRALHMVTDPMDYLAYRIFVVVIGLVVAMLSVTGVYVWWKKRRARLSRRSHGAAAKGRSGARRTASTARRW